MKTFGGAAQLFPKAPIPILEFEAPIAHTLDSTCYVNTAVAVGIKYYLTVVLTCISLVTNHGFCAYMHMAHVYFPQKHLLPTFKYYVVNY